jgi:hypothetical protein
VGDSESNKFKNSLQSEKNKLNQKNIEEEKLEFEIGNGNLDQLMEMSSKWQKTLEDPLPDAIK